MASKSKESKKAAVKKPVKKKLVKKKRNGSKPWARKNMDKMQKLLGRREELIRELEKVEAQIKAMMK